MNAPDIDIGSFRDRRCNRTKKKLKDWWQDRKDFAFHTAPAQIAYHPWVAAANKVLFVFAKHYPELFVCVLWGWTLGWPLATMMLLWLLL